MTDRVLDLVAAHDERELAEMLIEERAVKNEIQRQGEAIHADLLKAQAELVRLRKIEEAARYLMELYDEPDGQVPRPFGAPESC